MNYFLMLIILGLCGGGYYEYTFFQQRLAGDQQQISDLHASLDPAVTENQKLEADNADLKKGATESQTEIADLTQQLQTAQTELAEAKQKPFQLSSVTASSTTAPAQNANDLGTIGTKDGKIFPNCQLLKVQTDCIVINYNGGITQVAYSLMPPTLQKRFGYDPLVMTGLTPDQVEALEQKRKTAAGY